MRLLRLPASLTILGTFPPPPAGDVLFKQHLMNKLIFFFEILVDEFLKNSEFHRQKDFHPPTREKLSVYVLVEIS